MPFIYYGQGVASLYNEFTEHLMSHLAREGTEITRQVLNPTSAQMHVKRSDETGSLEFAVEGENIKVIYTVERVKKEISTGVMGAVTGAGLGSILGTVLRKGEGLQDTITGAVGGAAAGGATGAYYGYEQSKTERTEFAALLAETIETVETELSDILRDLEEAREATREKAREKMEEDAGTAEEYRVLLEELYGQILAVQEELDVAKGEGAKMEKPKARLDRAEKLYREAQAAFNKKEFSSIKPKVTAAQSMVDKARELMVESG
jgi:hypothetical protein